MHAESLIINFDDITSLIDEFQLADARGKRKPARRAAFLAASVEQSDAITSLSDIDLLQKALSIGIRYHDWPSSWQASKARLHLRKREILKTPEPITLFETKGVIDVEMAAITLIDAASSLGEAFFEVGSEVYKKARERGDFFDVSLGMDCLVKLKLRYVDCSTPELSSAEIKRLISATDIAFIKTDSKKLKLVGGGKKSVEIETNSTDVNASFYLVGCGKSQQIICVCCSATNARPEYFDAQLELFDS